MKRGEPLKRKTPLRAKTQLRSKAGLDRGSGLQRAREMKPKSAKRRKVDVDRRTFVREVLAARPWCEACTVVPGRIGMIVRVRPSHDVHELKRRSQGGSVLDASNVLAVCRVCHDWIGENPGEAFTRGLAVPSWAGPDDYVHAADLREMYSKAG